MNIILSIPRNKILLPGYFISRSAAYRVLIIAIATAICLRSGAQLDQRIAMADKYFAAGEYFTAADLYEQYLNPVKKEAPKANFPLNSRRYNEGSGSGNLSKLDILFKQAESYRLSNHWPEAAARYKECFEKDSAKYADAFYWYAVCMRSMGNYAAAEGSMERFLKNDVKGNISGNQIEKELQTIQFIKRQLTRPDTVLYKVKKTNTNFSSEKGVFALSPVNGNQFLVTSTAKDTATINGVNPYHSRIYTATLANGVLSDPELINIAGADISLNQGAACLSADKNFLYFTQWSKVNGKNISSIYYSAKTSDGWAQPVLISSINKSGFSSRQPFCSADGKTLFFASDMPGGTGQFDIWYASINADGSVGEAVNAGAEINTAGDEQAPFYHNSGSNLIFSSNGRMGMGGFDLFASKMNGSNWNKPENMGYPVNSSRDDIYFYAPEGKEILSGAIIGSDRGSECCLETYTVTKSPKKKMISGIVLDCKNNEPVDGAEVEFKDAQGKNLKMITGPDGKFSFELAGDISKKQFHISKNEYNDKTETASVESINDADLMTDIYQNTPLCIEKIVIVEKKLVIKAENVVTLYFDFDKSLVRSREEAILDSIYTVLVENNTATIQISGYTDGLGSDEYNNKLSDRRAKACADYLKKKGLEPGRISFVSFGECCPVEMELINGRDNPDGRSKNRRALINISKE